MQKSERQGSVSRIKRKALASLISAEPSKRCGPNGSRKEFPISKGKINKWRLTLSLKEYYRNL